MSTYWKQRGRRGRDPMVVQSVPMTIKVASSNPAHGKVYLIQHYVIKFVSDLQQGLWFSLVFSNNTTDHHDITEILLKWALNTIIPNPPKLFDYDVQYTLFNIEKQFCTGVYTWYTRAVTFSSPKQLVTGILKEE
jgi:hypothetical protein